MPWSYIIDQQQRTVFTRFTGMITPSDVRDEINAVTSDPKFDPSFDQMVDASQGAPVSDFPTDKVREFAASSIYSKTSRRAIVMSGDLGFGLARMFATYREIRGELNLQIFRERNAALQWLGAKDPSTPGEQSAKI